jgi:hypothetical protein
MPYPQGTKPVLYLVADRKDLDFYFILSCRYKKIEVYLQWLKNYHKQRKYLTLLL